METETSGRALLNRVRLNWPTLSLKLEEFPSGAFMLDLDIAGETYVAEYLPSFSKFGLSRLTSASYGWEGVEEEFPTMEQLFDRLAILMASRTEREESARDESTRSDKAGTESA